jgi:hypothetical protein
MGNRDSFHTTNMGQVYSFLSTNFLLSSSVEVDSRHLYSKAFSECVVPVASIKSCFIMVP